MYFFWDHLRSIVFVYFQEKTLSKDLTNLSNLVFIKKRLETDVDAFTFILCFAIKHEIIKVVKMEEI